MDGTLCANGRQSGDFWSRKRRMKMCKSRESKSNGCRDKEHQ